MAITHTIARTVTASGIVEHPDEVEPIYGEHEGETLESGSGVPTNVWTGSKRRWRLTWQSPRPEIAERWRVRYAARTTFTFVDPLGASYTVTMPVGGLTLSYRYQPGLATTVGTIYPMTCEVWEV